MTRKAESPRQLMLLSDNLKADRCALMYLTKCTTTELTKFSPKKNRKVLCGEYYAVKRTLLKYPECLVLLYSYLYALPEKELMDLSEAFRRAAKYNQEMKLKNDKEKAAGLPVENYVDYQEILKKMLEVN